MLGAVEERRGDARRRAVPRPMAPICWRWIRRTTEPLRWATTLIGAVAVAPLRDLDDSLGVLCDCDGLDAAADAPAACAACEPA